MRTFNLVSAILCLAAVTACSDTTGLQVNPNMQFSKNPGAQGNSATASATAVVFEDNFDNSNYCIACTPNGWSVVAGSVDVVGADTPFDWYPGNGLYVDLDGATWEAGTIARSMSLKTGNYLLTYDVGGSMKDGSPMDTVVVNAGNTTDTFEIASDAGIETHTLAFSVKTSTVTISIGATGTDNMGPALLRVRLERL